jgi:hypothetical protein
MPGNGSRIGVLFVFGKCRKSRKKYIQGSYKGNDRLGSDSYAHKDRPSMDPGAKTTFACGIHMSGSFWKEVWTMSTLEKDVKRMELQIGQLVRIVANQNERLNRFEEIERKRRIMAIHKIPLAERV